MIKFNLPDTRTIDLLNISKDSNITQEDIFNNFIECIIKENLGEMYSYLEPTIHDYIFKELKHYYRHYVRYGMMHIKREIENDILHINNINESSFTKNTFICPKCGSIYLLDNLERNKIDETRCKCTECDLTISIEDIFKLKDECVNIRINKFIQKCVKIRKEKNIKLTEMSKRTGFSKQSLNSLEKSLCRPKLDFLIKYLDVLGIDINKLFK